MRPRSVPRLAWTIWAASVAIVAGALVLGIANHPDVPFYDFWFESTVLTPLSATLGALIVVRRPGNVIGWIFLIPSIVGGMQFFSGQYATIALNPGAELPGGAVAAWLSNLMQLSVVAAFLFLMLLFPTGTLLSARWRIISWAAGVAFTANALALAFSPGPLENFLSTQNPFGIETDSAVFGATAVVAGGGAVVCFLAAVVSLILRFLRSKGEERLQLKWFAYAAAVGVSLILFASFLFPTKAMEGQLGTFVWTLGPLGLPVSAGIAVLKYHLYDIDRLINRTLVYGGLTVLLVLVYVAGVVGLGETLRSFFGQEDNNLAVAASTLAVAALFRPARTRIQSFIDRRFYRAKYDATRTLEAFGARLRDEVDLDELTGDLLVVVKDTMQPAHASLWLKTAPRVGFARSLGSHGRIEPITAQTSEESAVR